MTWLEFNDIFDFKIFDELMSSLNNDSDEKYNKQLNDRKKRKHSDRKHSFRNYQYITDNIQYAMLPLKEINGKYEIKYSKTYKNKDSYEENILGYFQKFEIGYVFVSLDSSHMWKRLRESIVLKNEQYQTLILGSNMIFCKLNEIEFDKRYYFYKNDEIDDSSFLFKSSCVRINDVYVGSNKSHRYFLILDFAYTSNDFTTNNYVNCDTFFNHIKELSNEDILIIFDQKTLSDRETVMQKYSDKMLNKLLRI